MADRNIYTPKTAPARRGKKTTPMARIVALILAALMILGGAVSTIYYLFGQAKAAPAPAPTAITAAAVPGDAPRDA